MKNNIKSKFTFEDLPIDKYGQIIFLDIDGTLIADDGGVGFTPEVLNKINELKGVNRVFLCTNSHDRIRNIKIGARLNLPIVSEQYKKPDHRILHGMGLSDGDKKLVIGDKFLTDGRFAKNIGAEFLKVKRKISGKESLSVKIINLADDISWQILNLLKII